jgi:hypothetical protein
VLCLLLGTSDKDRHLSYIQILSEAACKIFTAQPTVVNVEQPCKVFGDIHGQFRDLLLLFSRYITLQSDLLALISLCLSVSVSLSLWSLSLSVSLFPLLFAPLCPLSDTDSRAIAVVTLSLLHMSSMAIGLIAALIKWRLCSSSSP